MSRLSLLLGLLLTTLVAVGKTEAAETVEAKSNSTSNGVTEEPEGQTEGTPLESFDETIMSLALKPAATTDPKKSAAPCSPECGEGPQLACPKNGDCGNGSKCCLDTCRKREVCRPIS